MKINKANSLQYSWGQQCKAWHFVNTENLSVILEEMPPGASEQIHKHQRAQQFFYILKGEATFRIARQFTIISSGEGIHVLPNTVHCIQNLTKETLQFLVISEPHAHGDRIRDLDINQNNKRYD